MLIVLILIDNGMEKYFEIDKKTGSISIIVDLPEEVLAEEKAVLIIHVWN